MVGSAVEYTIDELKKMGHDMTTVRHFVSARAAGIWVRDYVVQSDEQRLILAKGSQNTIFVEEAVEYLLANPDDVYHLPRQSSYWKSVKNTFFDSLHSHDSQN